MSQFKMYLLALVLMTGPLALAETKIRCSAKESGMDLAYLTDITWIDANSAKVELSFLSQGRQTPFCKETVPFTVTQSESIYSFAGSVRCEDGSLENITMVYDSKSMTLQIGPRYQTCR